MSENEERVNVGKKLREAREKKGLTLDDLQQATKIQKRYLIAIEGEKFDELPGDFYVRAFVKQYADTVGLDGNTLLKDYDDDLPQTKTAEYSNHLAQAVETRTGNRQPTVDRARRYLPTVIIAVVVVIILGAIWATAIVRNRQDAATKIDSSSVSVSGESSKKSSSSSSSSKSSSSSSKAAKLEFTAANRTTSSVTLSTTSSLTKDTDMTIKASGQAWTSVTVDGTSKLSKALTTNSTSTVSLPKGAQTVVLTLGNASATTVKIGDQTLDLTDSGKYANTRTVTIKFGATTTASSSASSTSTSAASSSVATTTNSTSTTATTNTSTQSSSTR
ncbi:helix-turn-helix domain-containing protein [Limosilactobacillus fermentum]|uniref:helix-turn-helix domain-containing protein n=1 Tax=Limosilactobacillus fermentum TaxID=1613 RepID=UPI0021A35B31|nr:RodZ domain-containing protein [Limosilactobacillus fermentum]MCT2872429.1 helix-turn-helix domain-containing protein [Limosilactobacillus fermentum]